MQTENVVSLLSRSRLGRRLWAKATPLYRKQNEENWREVDVTIRSLQGKQSIPPWEDSVCPHGEGLVRLLQRLHCKCNICSHISRRNLSLFSLLFLSPEEDGRSTTGSADIGVVKQLALYTKKCVQWAANILACLSLLACGMREFITL